MSNMFATSDGVEFHPDFEAPIMHKLYSQVAGMLNSGMSLREVQECAISSIIKLDPTYTLGSRLAIDPHIYHYIGKDDLAGDVLVFKYNDASDRELVLDKSDLGFNLITLNEFTLKNGIDINTGLFNYIDEI